MKKLGNILFSDLENKIKLQMLFQAILINIESSTSKRQLLEIEEETKN